MSRPICEHNRNNNTFTMDGKTFDVQTMSKMFKILFGQDWKSSYTNMDRAMEMLSIFNEGTKPCVDFTNWVALIDFIRDYKNAPEIKPISEKNKKQPKSKYWNDIAQKLKDEFGESLTDDNTDESDQYSWWLVDVTVADMINFFRENTAKSKVKQKYNQEKLFELLIGFGFEKRIFNDYVLFQYRDEVHIYPKRKLELSHFMAAKNALVSNRHIKEEEFDRRVLV